MSFYNFFKNLFGIPNYKNDNFDETQRPDEYYNQNENGNYWGPESEAEYEDMRSHDPYTPSDDIMKFNIFTDPLEMHRYFEYQMNDILKSFTGFFDQGSSSIFSDNFPGLTPPQPHSPAIQHPRKNLRDQFLRPGYESIKESNSLVKPRTDQDLDGIINADDLDELLKDKVSKSQNIILCQERPLIPLIPQIRSFGQSITSKTIRRSDGTVETHRTVRDHAGNEETAVTRHIGDKQYTVTVRTDKDGKQEKIEDMINIDEKELSKFIDQWNRSRQSQNSEIPTEPDLNKLFPYDKFFK